jgi:hypothetical protein
LSNRSYRGFCGSTRTKPGFWEVTAMSESDTMAVPPAPLLTTMRHCHEFSPVENHHCFRASDHYMRKGEPTQPVDLSPAD